MRRVGFLYLVPLILAIFSRPAFAWTGHSEFSFDFDTTAYPFAANQLKDSIFPSVGFHFSGGTEGNSFATSLQADFRIYANKSVPWYAELPEAWIGSSALAEPAFQFRFGRELIQWNRLDEQWRLGIWQPRFRWDFVSPMQTGLIGAYVHINTRYFQATAFGTPFFVPERGDTTSISNGAVSSPSMWMAALPNAYPMGGVLTPAHYDVAMPSLMSVIFNPGASIQLRGGEAKGPYASVGYAFKPINQMLTSVDVHLDVTTMPNNLNLMIHPRFLFHHLASGELGYEGRNWGAAVSVLYERPVEDTPDPNWISQQITESIALSPSVYWKINPALGFAPRLDLAYLRQWGGNAATFVPSNLPVGQVPFENRYPYQNAVLLGAQSELPLGFSISTRTLYDISHDGLIFSGEARYTLFKHWVFSIGGDVLVSGAFTGVPGSGDFIANFQDNDRVHAGVRYVF
ncbi:MAG: hypothetical protein ACXWP5_12775 [Bdellovibrionota bacterium]